MPILIVELVYLQCRWLKWKSCDVKFKLSHFVYWEVTWFGNMKTSRMELDNEGHQGWIVTNYSTGDYPPFEGDGCGENSLIGKIELSSNSS